MPSNSSLRIFGPPGGDLHKKLHVIWRDESQNPTLSARHINHLRRYRVPQSRRLALCLYEKSPTQVLLPRRRQRHLGRMGLRRQQTGQVRWRRSSRVHGPESRSRRTGPDHNLQQRPRCHRCAPLRDCPAAPELAFLQPFGPTRPGHVQSRNAIARPRVLRSHVSPILAGAHIPATRRLGCAGTTLALVAQNRAEAPNGWE